MRAEPELDPDPDELGRLVRQRFLQLAVRRDRVADEPSDLLALVEDRDPVPEGSELAGADEPGRAGADHGNPSPVPRRRLAKRRAVAKRLVRGVALERADRDRLAAHLGQHAGSLAEDFGRADSRARGAEQVLGEDRLRRRLRIAVRDRGHEARDVDACRAGNHAGRGGVRPAAFEAAVGFEQRVLTREWSAQLLEDRLRRGNTHQA